MLAWLQNKLSRKQQLILKVVCLVAFLHIVVAGILFFGPSNHNEKTITLHTTPTHDMKVVFLPLYKSLKRVSLASNSQGQTAVKKHGPSSPAPTQPVQPPPQKTTKQPTPLPAQSSAQPKKQPQPSVKKQPEKKSSPEKPKVQKVEPPKKTTASNPVKKSSPPKPVPAAQEQPPLKTKPEIKPQPIKQKTPPPQSKDLKDKPQSQEQKPPPPAPQPEKLHVVEQEQHKPPVSLLDNVEAININLGGGQENVLSIGQEEYELRAIKENLQKELARVWKAPKVTSGSGDYEVYVDVDEHGRSQQTRVTSDNGKLCDITTQNNVRNADLSVIKGRKIILKIKGI